MTKRRVFRFAYPTVVRKERGLQPFQMRDGDAAMMLSYALACRGYEYAGPIFNYPYLPVAGVRDLRTLERREVDPLALDQSDERRPREGDLILLSTRPPMDDPLVGDRRFITQSGTSLEFKLFQGPLRRWFRTCARSEIVLTSGATAIAPEIAARESMVFHQNGGATYQSYASLGPAGKRQTFKKGPNKDRVTAAFLIYEEHAWPGGPAFLAAFGMGGIYTLGWSYLLATKYRELLCETSFAMAEIRSRPLTGLPTSMDFVDSWEVTLLGAERRTPVAA